MTTEQTIQDVAMIARNGIDRVIELERENKRLAEALANANEQAERFEREWYLRGDEIERLQEVSDEMFAAMTAAPQTKPQPNAGLVCALGLKQRLRSVSDEPQRLYR